MTPRPPAQSRFVKGHADRTSGHVSSYHERYNQLCDRLAVAAVPA